MLLYRNGLGLFDQEELAIKFGAKINAEDAAAFSADMPAMTSANFDEDIQTVESEQRINAFFRENGMPLVAQTYKHSAIPRLDEFLTEHLQLNFDIWVEYHAQEIHPNDKCKGYYIHDGLVESFDTSRRLVTLIDPLPEQGNA